MIRNERLAASVDGAFVVLLIGLRINRPWLAHKWLPMLSAMPRMINELQRHPEMGFLHSESWLGRTAIMMQYWRSIEQLQAYAHDRTAAHLPAWRRFNLAVGTDGSVGIWHETYLASAGSYESIYVNMPPFELGRAGQLVRANGSMQTAVSRMARRQDAASTPTECRPGCMA